MKKLIPIFLLFSNVVFSQDFQARLSLSMGAVMTFSTAKHNIWKQYNGFRMGGYPFILNTLFSTGYNFKIKNDILTSISVLAETGYNFSGYSRPTDKNFGSEGGTFYFHSLVLGLISTLNFYNDVSLGIGAGVMFPLHANIFGYWELMGDYTGVKELSYKDIKKLYKVPVMPYIKLSVEKTIKYNKVDLIAGGVFTYNFGMSCDSEVLTYSSKAMASFAYNNYKFSAFSAEVFIGFGFGRPK